MRVLAPLLIGVITGLPAGLLLRKERSKTVTLVSLIGMILLTSFLDFVCNTYLMPKPVLNFMLMGMAFSATFSNRMTEERLDGPAPESAKIIQGTIAAAAVINEIIAVIAAKKGFEWAGEFHKKE